MGKIFRDSHIIMAKFSIWPVTVDDMRCCNIIRVLSILLKIGGGGGGGGSLNSAVNDCHCKIYM